MRIITILTILNGCLDYKFRSTLVDDSGDTGATLDSADPETNMDTATPESAGSSVPPYAWSEDSDADEVLSLGTGAVAGALGYSVAPAGDMDGDGRDDALVGAPEANGGRGAVVLWFGPSPEDESPEIGTVLGTTADDLAGWAMVGGTDWDGDGREDLVIGAPNHTETASMSGAVYVVAAPEPGRSSDLSESSLVLTSTRDGNNAGFALTLGLRADGSRFMAVGAPQQDAYEVWGGSAQGGIYLVEVGESGHEDVAAWPRAHGEQSGDCAGWSVASADVDGDGTSELWVGAPGWTGDDGAYQGAAYLIPDQYEDGSRLDDIAMGLVYGGKTQDLLGWAVAAGGDLDGDGTPDLAVGMPGFDPARAGEATRDGAGAVTLFLSGDGLPAGSGGLSIGSVNIFGAEGGGEDGEEGDRVGFSVSFAGDMTGDGVEDLLVGGYGVDQGSMAQVGAVWLVPGPFDGDRWLEDDDAAQEVIGTEREAWFGSSVAGVGDTNGDGAPDAVVGCRWCNDEDGGAFALFGVPPL